MAWPIIRGCDGLSWLLLRLLDDNKGAESEASESAFQLGNPLSLPVEGNLPPTVDVVVFVVDKLPLVELDDIKMNKLYGLPPNHVPIMLKTESFQVIMPGKQKNVSVNRSHFPIVPRFSCTAHKSQGQTLRKAIIDLVPRTGTSKGLGIEFAYVPLSRVRRLQDLTILRPFDSSVLKAKVKDGCTAMMEEFKSKDLCKDL